MDMIGSAKKRAHESPLSGELDLILIDPVIRRALEEDIGPGDITTKSVVWPETKVTGRLIAKEDGLICGLPVFCRVFEMLDNSVKVTLLAAEGSPVMKNDVLARIEGPANVILTGERVALNFLQRMSGIATRTAQAVQQISGTRARITDTRKTAPGLRLFDKYAVRAGGGVNHRFGLSDGILIKDNHIQAAGGIAAAVKMARSRAPHTLRVEVEVESLAQVDEALEAGADIIMLDNMDLAGIAAAAARIGGRALVEISGNMGDKDLRSLAATGIDLISIGALTHSVRAMDISLRLDPIAGYPL